MSTKAEEFADLVLKMGLAALRRANNDCTFFDRGNEHRELLPLVSAAHASELIIKAAIIKQNPLSIFVNPQEVAGSDGRLDTRRITFSSKTIQASRLPHIYKTTTTRPFPSEDIFRSSLEKRNQLQHLFHPETVNFIEDALHLTFKVTDIVLNEDFGLCAVEFHEDVSIQTPDYLVEQLARRNIKFRVPSDLTLPELDLEAIASKSTNSYRHWLLSQLSR